MLFFLFLLQASCIFGEESPRRCSGGYQHGSRVDRGRYWYECQDGQLVPKGCLTEDLRHMDLWETYDDDGVRMQCVIDRDGYLAFAYKSCVSNGREYQVNEQWEDQKNFFICKRDREFVKIAVVGCIDKSGKRVAVNEKVVKDDFVYQCKKANDQSFGVVRIGCYDNGRHFAVGDTFDKSNNLWYTCTSSGNGEDSQIAVKCIGCIQEGGRHLRDGDHYVRDDIIYGCSVNGEDTRIVAIGCVTRDNGVAVEKRVNCSWVEGDEPYQYEVTCKKLENNGAIRIPVRCMYTVLQGSYTIDPGCYRVVDKSAIACLKISNSQLQIRAFRMDDIGDATRLGLRFC